MEAILIEAAFKKKLYTAHGELLLDVAIKVENGEMVSLYGPSGVGKTTILRILAGLTNADEGYIKVDNEVWFDSSAKVNLPVSKRPVGYMFQDYALFPNMSIKENLKYAQPKPDAKHICELLELFDLVTLKDRKPDMLSGGQQQRVALARALARKPKILMLDEPLSAIDPEFRVKLQDEILDMHRRFSITTLLVCHDLPEVFKLSRKVIVLENGKIIKKGSPYKVFGDKKISGKVQFVAEVMRIEDEDIVKVLTLLTGNTLVKVAVCDNDDQHYNPGDKVLIVSKAFNPVIQKISS